MIKYMNLVGRKARKAFEQKIDTKIKNKVLNKYAELLGNEKKLILKQNLKDANYAKKIGIIAKSTVNASHCKIINETLTPSKKEVLKSIKIKNKFENAIKENRRQVFHNGQYLELPAFKAAVSILNRHYALLSYENL